MLYISSFSIIRQWPISHRTMAFLWRVLSVYDSMWQPIFRNLLNKNFLEFSLGPTAYYFWTRFYYFEQLNQGTTGRSVLSTEVVPLYKERINQMDIEKRLVCVCLTHHCCNYRESADLHINCTMLHSNMWIFFSK